MDRMISWWAHNPVAANLLMIGIFLSGTLGFLAMERETFPVFKPHQVEIMVTWPGAAPQEVEEQIVIRIEEALKGIDNLFRTISTAQEGFARIEVSTYPGVDLEKFLTDVKGVVDSVNSLPRDIENPIVRRVEQRDETMRVVVHGDLGEKALTHLAEDLRREIAALPFVSMVELFGTRNEEVTVEVSEQAMQRYGLTFTDVSNAIRASSVNSSSGTVRTDTGDVLLRVRNLADNQEQFEHIVVRQTPGGGIVRIGDVARVIDGFEDNEILATLNGEPAVLFQILASDNMQVVKASDAVRTWMEKTQRLLPAGVELSVWFDQADQYKSRMGTIENSAILGLLLVFTVLILSLRPKVALWVTSGIAVAFIGTFALLPGLDVSLNTLSTFAFLMVLGIVVDDAIVVGESVYQHSHLPGNGTDLAVKGTVAVSKPVMYAVLTTMIAFAPWFFLSTEEAQFTRQLSIVITLALSISLIEAFLILPAHLRHLEPRPALHGIAKWQKGIERSIVNFADKTYRRWVAAVIRYRYLTASIFLAAFIVSVGVLSAGWVKFTFMPEIENDLFYVNVVLPTGTPYARALEVLDHLQQAERKLIDEVNQRAETEGGTGKLIEAWYTRSRRDSVIAIVKLSPPEVRDMTAKEAALRLRELIGDIPDADEITVNYTIDDNAPRVNYVLRSRDLDLLQRASNELKAQLYTYNGTYFVRDNTQGETDELHMQLKPGAEKLGITLAEVSRQVRQAYYGEEVQRLPREYGDVRVMVRYPREARNSLQSLANFRVRTADGRDLPLLSVVDLEVGRGMQNIHRRDGERMIEVTADVVEDVMSDITRDMQDNFIPSFQQRYPGLEIGKSGQAEAEEEFFNEILALYLVAMFTMYALIAIAFHSYWLPLLVMTAIPFGFMGAVYGHLFFGISLAIFSYFGIGAAAGVVVNDNLVLVDYVGRMRDQGLSSVDAMIEAAVVRFRPILLTSVTTFVGLLPTMAGRSMDAAFLKPAVVSLAFGVLFALFVTLLLVPALYEVGQDVVTNARVLRSKVVDLLRSKPAGQPSRPAHEPGLTS